MFNRPPVLFLIIAAAAYGQNARLSAPGQTLGPGQTVMLSLTLTSAGKSLTAIQVDLQWDASIGVRVTAGDATRAASKVLYAAPMGTQQVRCLIVGMENSVLGDGELLRLFLSADPSNAAAATIQLGITNVTASDAAGTAIAVEAAPIKIQLQNGIPSQLLPTEAVLNAASLSPGPLSPGEIITLFGLNGPPPVSVRIGGVQAPLLYAGADQINAVVPFGLNVSAATTLEVSGPSRKVTLTLPVAPVSPAIFTANGSGLGQGAILNEDYTINSFSNPALPGSTVMIYGTAFGTVQLPVTDGMPVPGENPTSMPVTATVGGLAAEVVYAGAAPGLLAGVMQINIRIPAGLAHNASTPLALHVSGAGTAQGVTIAIQ